MRRAAFIPRLRDNGEVDLSCLEGMGDEWIWNWLKSRLSGDDPHFPIDPRVGEDPEALVVGLLREAGERSGLWRTIARAVRYLLYEASDVIPEVPPFFGPALRICQRCRFTEVEGWFVETLRRLAENSDPLERAWGERLVKEITYAAVLQIPGIPTSPARQAWLHLFEDPRYTTIALRGLGASFSQRLSYLPQWWQICARGDREKQVDNMIFTALKVHSFQEICPLLQSQQYRFPYELEVAINDALERYGAARVFIVHGSYIRSIMNAGRRSEMDPPEDLWK
ncbi:MAG TPA: hypothetical protein VLB76_01960 [Thermoanaerobaculia bacterium]|jgi:hypothetical protein|nr:hypothetical protein [Thermoanaerobaculia bacterium]